MKYSAVSYMKKVASKNFKLSDLEFSGFDKVGFEEKIEIAPEEEYSADIELWADLSLKYEGTPPDSYRVLNGMIQDWVDDNEDEIKKLVNPNLITFLKEQYKEIDLSELDENFDDFIWEDQVDYMVQVDEKSGRVKFTVELVLEVEEEEKE